MRGVRNEEDDRVESEKERAPDLARIAAAFGRYGNLTLGGGSATLAVIHRELIGRRRWLAAADFDLCFALARLTPGTNFFALCVGLSFRLRGARGAAVALLATSLPGALLVVIATALFTRWQALTWAGAAIGGASAAAVGITVYAAWIIVAPHLRTAARLRSALVVVAAFALHAFAGLSAITVIATAGALGALLPPRA
ncbi:MAG: chromate transporter [Gammaproteobacteria bacterium]|nr:chromate transporter [Gammaproteobacteria bacterium]MBI5615626.1 chromate transporter [Gammaproteobacteria bacterium]